jgi:hypothetical protein
MSTPRIAQLITHIPVRPTPLFHNDVDGAGSHDDDEAAVEETLAMQDQADLGEVEKLALRFSLLDLSSCMDMWEPWVEEGPKSKKVSISFLIPVKAF